MFISIQFDSLLSSSFMFKIILSICFPLQNTLVSSANNIENKSLDTFVKSLNKKSHKEEIIKGQVLNPVEHRTIFLMEMNLYDQKIQIDIYHIDNWKANHMLHPWYRT